MYNRHLIQQISDILLNSNQSVAIAESVTSGHLQVAFSLGTNASKFLQGGMTVFNLGQKVRHLDVEPINAEADNCVNQSVAITMAKQIQKKFISNYGLGITGYASCVPEINNKPLHAFFALSFNSTVIAKHKLISYKTDYLEVQLDYVNQVLEIFLKQLLQSQCINSE